ncbi:lytic transglycosylase domain-containing protein [Mycobacterium sp. OTB74]|jgi:membrane-bound lytic murein transglycosylase B|uniref:lytic transglycosylase domain-containing protein n=1 Tax=Mycobacterium sp. OTB74 TaxID=1853452 RepID=UPI002476EF1C|nr:lytic transglycosylase domain-containing protein [Mycobacterium sp. OTB74]MDH6247185.1 membrane-bound lytic murein transglycosylase B [Mycobacterium sp. OTB74]
MARGIGAALVAMTVVLVGCGPSTADSDPTPSEASPVQAAAPLQPATEAPPPGAQPRLAAEPAQVADDLVADEQAVRDPSTSEPALTTAAHRQQAAYRAIAKHPDWDGIIAPRIPPALAAAYRHNVDAARGLSSMTAPRDTVPPWTIQAPAPADELLGYYHDAQAASGVDWNYLAAVNLVESRFGRINGNSPDGAQGPMQFLPATFAQYGAGGDIHAPRDAIMAAGRYLAANGFAADRDSAIHHYNHSATYVDAINDYAAVLAADPAAFAGYYRWDVYVKTIAGDLLLPVGYSASSPTPAADYLAAHPQ